LRISELFGIHLGGGFAGGTLGVRFHTGAETHSPFIGINLKDGGFGSLNVVAAQYGGTWILTKASGIRYEIGIHKLLSIDKQFEEEFFGKGKSAPPIGISLGLGWAW
jgi:hypothetical protein